MPTDRIPNAQRGVTLIEGIIVMLVVALFGLIAAPQITNIVVAQRLRAAGTDLVSSLYLARSESIKRNANVTVRPATPDDWTAGWVVASAGGEQVDRRAGPGARVHVSRAPEAIVYTPSGRLEPLGVARVEFSDVERHPGVAARCVIVDTAGVPRLEARECP